jgi:folylpolyglutamate synthase/dihydropteroate synthase
VLGQTHEEIAKEKLAVAHAARIVVLLDNTHAQLVPEGARIEIGGAREAAEAFLGRPVSGEVQARLPGRLERRGGEVWDGAHTPEAVEWLLARLPARDYILCVSLLSDKDADGVLERLSEAGRTLVATQSSNPRSLPAEALAERARHRFAHVETHREPAQALARARELGDRVLVTGSLYLLADFHE